MLITSLDFSSFTGRIAIGRLERGSLNSNMSVSLCKRNGNIQKSKIKELHVFDGLGRKKTDEVIAGDLCAIVGLEEFEIGDTIADADNPEALPAIKIDEPTIEFGANPCDKHEFLHVHNLFAFCVNSYFNKLMA